VAGGSKSLEWSGVEGRAESGGEGMGRGGLSREAREWGGEGMRSGGDASVPEREWSGG